MKLTAVALLAAAAVYGLLTAALHAGLYVYTALRILEIGSTR